MQLERPASFETITLSNWRAVSQAQNLTAKTIEELFRPNVQDVEICERILSFLQSHNLQNIQSCICGYIPSQHEKDNEPNIIPALTELARQETTVALPRYNDETGEVTYHEFTNEIDWRHDIEKSSAIDVLQPKKSVPTINAEVPSIFLRPGNVADGHFVLSRNMGYDHLLQELEQEGKDPLCIGVSRKMGTIAIKPKKPVHAIITPEHTSVFCYAHP